MAEDQKKQPPAGNDDEQAKIQDTLKKMEEQMAELAVLRKRRSIIVLSCIVIIVLTIILLIFNMVNFVRNYNTLKLVEELEKNALVLSQQDDTINLLQEVKNDILPLVQDEFVKRFKKELPKFQGEVTKVTENLQHYLTNDVKSKLVIELSKATTQLEKELLTKYPKITPEKMHEIINIAQAEVIDRLTASLESKLNSAMNDVTLLHEHFEKIKETEDYKKLKPSDCHEIEDKLIEAVLELAIYKINPERGKQRAFTDKGGK